MARNHYGTNLCADVTSTLSIILTDNNGLGLFAKCTGAAPTTASLFSHGCLIIQTDTASGSSALYENTGTSALPVWNLVGAISPSEITLAEGQMLVGNALGVAAASSAITIATGALGTINLATGANGDINIDPAGTGTIDLEANTEISGDLLVQVQKDGAVGAILTLSNGSASPAAADDVGEVVFKGVDSGAAATDYARISGQIVAATAGSERGALIFQSTVNGSLVSMGQMTQDATNAFFGVGNGTADGIVRSVGNFDLILRTGNATTGSITIADGANGAINITPNGTGVTSVGSASGTASLEGFVAINGPLSVNDIPISISGAGAISPDKTNVDLDSTAGAMALTLADATVGRHMFIRMIADGGDAVLTPDNLLGAATTITFDDVGDTVHLAFSTGGWAVMGGTATVA